MKLNPAEALVDHVDDRFVLDARHHEFHDAAFAAEVLREPLEQARHDDQRTLLFDPHAAAAEGKPGKARPVRTYKLTPGTAYLYNEGDLHSPRRRGPTRLIRIEGVNMDRIQRLKFEVVA